MDRGDKILAWALSALLLSIMVVVALQNPPNKNFVNTLVAAGTLLSAAVAVGIAVFGNREADRRLQKEFEERERKQIARRLAIVRVLQGRLTNALTHIIVYVRTHGNNLMSEDERLPWVSNIGEVLEPARVGIEFDKYEIDIVDMAPEVAVAYVNLCAKLNTAGFVFANSQLADPTDLRTAHRVFKNAIELCERIFQMLSVMHQYNDLLGDDVPDAFNERFEETKRVYEEFGRFIGSAPTE